MGSRKKRLKQEQAIEENGEADAAAGGNTEKRSSSVEKTKSVKELSKRQRRKLPNDKHKWPHHPKIQSMTMRNKAYIRTAGLGSGNGKDGDRENADNLDPSLDLMSPEVKFGRMLGGADQRTRHAAVLKLKAYLKARCDISNTNGGISELDLLKLWKGLWFTLYMADKVPVQDELSKRLSELIWCVAGTEEEDEYAGHVYMEMSEDSISESLRYDEDEEGTISDGDGDDEAVLREMFGTEETEDFDGSTGSSRDEDSETDEDLNGAADRKEDKDADGFGNDDEEKEEVDDSEVPHCRGAHLASLLIKTLLHTVRREWGNMDKYRVDKFYTLIRLYIHEVYKYMAARHWNVGIIRLFNDTIFDQVLSKTPNGLRYHLIDLSLEELAKVNSKAPMPLTEVTFLDALEPYFAMAQTGGPDGDDSVQERVLEKIMRGFLYEYSVVSDQATKEGNEDDPPHKNNSEEAESLIFDQVHVGTVGEFIFSMASDAETPDRFRKSLYDMHKSFLRRVKQVGRDVELPGDSGETEGEHFESPAEVNETEDVVEPAQTWELVEETRKSKKRALSQNYVSMSADDVCRKRTSTEETKTTPMEERQDQTVASDRSALSNGSMKDKAHKKEKKKKKKGVKRKGRDDDGDEVVTISLAEQRNARSQELHNKKEAAAKEDDQESNAATPTQEDGKRVKFRATNRCKSWKASMKALVSATPPKTSVTTPERGILLNRSARVNAKAEKMGRRKRAINYF